MSTTMSWIVLIIAGLCETGFAFCLGKMKLVSGFAWWAWGVGFAVFVVVSMLLLAKAAQVLPIGTAYPVWTGIGAVGTVLLGILFFKRAGDVLAHFLHHYADRLHRRTQDGIPLNF